jgi:hypothetical protein
MTKRISCKVIRTVALTKAANPSMYLVQTPQYSILDTQRASRNEKRETRRSLDILEAALDYRMIGQVLDCYA